MDASRILNNRRGFAIVYIALLLGLVAIAGLVLDLGYMFVNKAKLQNAADAGALAGAGRLKRQPLANLTGARNGAKQFADVNFNLTLNTNTTNDPGGDIVLGFWDNTATPPSFSVTVPLGKPVNAVKVVARRTGATGTGIGANTDFNLFLGKVIGIETMGAKASAIAYRPPRAGFNFFIGRNVCTSNPTESSPIPLTPQVGTENLAWASFFEPATSANFVKSNLFCPETPPFVEVCGKSIYTNNGVINSIFQSVELDFYDPAYDTANKTFAMGSNGLYVKTWTVIVPVAAEMDPTDPPDPHPVWGMAEITMIRVCSAGGGNPCNNGRTDFKAPPEANCGPGKKEIVISSIICVDCANSTGLLGAKPVLAQ